MNESTPVVNALVSAVTDALSSVFSWIGTFISQLTSDSGSLHALLPLFAVGIAISVILLGIKVVKSIVWGA